ncbi:cupin domain-containing protein [Nocardia sp. NPDC003345]
MNASPESLVLRQPGAAETLRTGAVTMRLLIDAEPAHGAVSTLEVTLDRGADGAAPHFHTLSDELFYVAEGELQLMAGDRFVTVGAGGCALVPKTTVHAFGATPDSGARILIALMPGVQRFGYFRLLERIARGEAAPEELAASQDEYDNHFVDAPRWWHERETGRR